MIRVPVLSEEQAWLKLASVKDCDYCRKLDGEDTLLNACQAIKEESTGQLQANSSTVASVLSSTDIKVRHKVNGNQHVQMVLAHCNEDLDWLPKLIEKGLLDSVYIYEKCDNHTHQFRKNKTVKFGDHRTRIHRVQLANTGKEGIAFLHHMIHVVDAGVGNADVLVFVQGELEWTTWRLEPVIRSCLEDGVCLAVSALARGYRAHGSYFWLGSQDDEIICTCIEALSGQKCTPEGHEKPEMYVTARGEFLTTSENIKRMMRGKWRLIVDAFYESMGKNMNPAEGHILERLWGMLLQGEDFDFHSNMLMY